MKATNLMCGDWVFINGIPHKIQAIDSIDAEILADNELYYIGENKYHSEDKIEGVFITPKILEKNGFEYITTDYEDVYQGPSYDGNTSTMFILFGENEITLASYYDYIGKGDIDAHTYATISYVHQLQHALRLCGLNELADNFKI